jgi:hypothetical protein
MEWMTVEMLLMRDLAWEQEQLPVLLENSDAEKDLAFQPIGSVMDLPTVLEEKMKTDVIILPCLGIIRGIRLDITLLLENISLGDEGTTIE